MKFQIVADGSCDLGREAEALGIRVVPFYVSFDDEHSYKEIEEIGVRDFYQQMVDHPKVFPKSSLPNVGDYLEVFTEYAEQGIPVVCSCLTAKLSASYTAACNARDILLEDLPEAKIAVFDSTVITVLHGILLKELVKMRDDRMDYQEAVAAVTELAESGRIFFTIGSMDYLIHGGRVGRVLGVAGKSLGIRPLIAFEDGDIYPAAIARSRGKSKEKVINVLQKYLSEVGAGADDYTAVIGYGYDYEEAVDFRKQLLASQSFAGDVKIYQIGATIGVHTGPYPLGVGILKHRKGQ